MLFSKNTRRQGKETKGNFVFRRRRQVVRVSLKHHLELNPETAATRRQKRMRAAGKGAKAAAALLFVMGLISAGKIVVKEAFVDHPRFILQHFSVVTDGDLTAPEIVAATELHKGVNLLDISLTQVKDRLTALPQVKHAKVSRGLPGLLFLEVEQRRPIAWLSCREQKVDPNVPGYGCLLDQDGHILPSNGGNATSRPDLPIIEVAHLERLNPGQRLESQHALAALALLHAHQDKGVDHGLRLAKIDATRNFALTAIYDGGLCVTFPRYETERQLGRLDRILAEATKHKWQLATVNLIVENNIPVTFRGTATADTTPSPPPRTIARAD